MLETFPLTFAELKKAVQDPWDKLDPCWFIDEIENMPRRESVILQGQNEWGSLKGGRPTNVSSSFGVDATKATLKTSMLAMSRQVFRMS